MKLGQSVICATGGKQLVKPCILLCQRTYFALSLATPPQFFYWSFQQHRDCACGNKRVTSLPSAQMLRRPALI